MRYLTRDVVAGLVVLGVGLVFFVGSLDLRMGSAMSMGPGYFPLAVSVIVMVLGVVIGLGGLSASEAVGEIHWRPMLAVLGAIAAFAIIMSQFGLVPAMIAGVLLAAVGDETSRLRQTVVLALVASVGAWLIFRVGLGLQLPGVKLPGWLG